MAKIKVLGDAIVITSALKVADLETIKRSDASALTLCDQDGNAVYAVMLGKSASIDKKSVCFNGVDAEGFAQLTILAELPAKAAARNKYVRENIAPLVCKLNAAEGALGGVAAHLARMTDAVMEDVEFIGEAPVAPVVEAQEEDVEEQDEE